MDWNVSVSFLVSIVFFDVMHVISSDYGGSGHGFGDKDTFDDLSSYCYVTCERTFFVNIFAFDRFVGGFET